MSKYSTIEEVLEELQQGRIILVTSDGDRENEGDLICAAGSATTENVNFMMVRGRGFACVPMSKTLCQKLQFPRIISDNKDNRETASMVSIDHTSTIAGVSAAEYSITAMKCVEENAKPGGFRRPGHIFPLVAEKNGVLERNGHTEATVGLMRLAGLEEYGLCCEIMREDGTIMRTPKLMGLVKKWGLKMVTIKVLQEYRKRNDKLAEQVTCVSFPTKYDDLRIYGYINRLNGEHHMALAEEEIGDDKNLLRRVHSECLTDDVFGSECYDCSQQFAAAMAQIGKESRDILSYIRQGGHRIGLTNRLRAYAFWDQGMDTLGASLALDPSGDLREYFIGAQILRDLGTEILRPLTNDPDKAYQLSGLGAEIVQHIPIQIDATVHDLFHLKTRQEGTGHLSNF